MPTQVNEKPTAKNDGFIAAQLERARGRIRWLDLLAGGLGLLAGALAFVVLMVLLDLQFKLADGTRQVLALFFLVAAGFYVWWAIVRPFRWQVNPHYVARRLEDTIGGDRNHVLNWIDLHDEKLPGTLRESINRGAAKDLRDADLDRAISNRRALIVGGVAGVLLGVTIGLFIALGPGPFGARFGRAFGRSLTVPSRTQIEIIRPEGGDGVVTIGGPATVVVRVTGRQPGADDAPALHYRHAPTEPFRRRAMQQDASRDWFATVGPLEVGTGFWYKVTAGDAETSEHRIGVRAAAMLSDFVATYRYRPYVNRADRTRTSRKLEDLRGTEVIVTARPNREVREARLEFSATEGPGDIVRGEVTPQGLRFRLVLDRPGRYVLRYTSTEGEDYADPAPSAVSVIHDNSPEVRFTAPAKNVSIPSNGQVPLQAEASDDIGLAALTLKVKVVGGPQLADVPYLPDEIGKTGTPRRVAYRELLVPAALKLENGTPAALKAGTTLEYWLEARDGCDYHKPNVTASERFQVTLDAAGDAAEQEKKREQERKKKEEHDKQQGEAVRKEKQERDDQKKKEESQEKADQESREKGNAGGAPPEKSDENKEPQDGETERQAEQLRNALNDSGDKGDKGESKPGEGKGADEKPKPGEGKGTDDAKKGEEKPGEAKDGDKGEKPGESKDGGKDEKGGEGKDEGKKGGMEGDRPGEGKPGDSGKGDKPGATKPDGKSDGKGEAKGEGRPGPEGKGEQKPGDTKPGDGEPGMGKDGTPDASAPPGEGKPGDDSKPAEKGEGKDGGPAPGMGPKPAESKPADPKPADGKPGDAKPSGGDAKPGESRGDGMGMGEGMGESKDGPPPVDGGMGKGGDGKADGKPAGGGMGTPGGGDKPAEGADGMGMDRKPGEAKSGGDGGGSGARQGGTGGDPQVTPPGPKEKPATARAMMLQLEEFRKAVSPDVLKNAKMSREQFERFLKDYAALAKRRQEREDERDNVRPGAPTALPSVGGVTGRPPATGPDTARGTGRPKPPPEYRESYADFLKRLGAR